MNELKLKDCKQAHECATGWLHEAEEDRVRLGPSYHRDLRIAALTEERRRLVGVYTRIKSGRDHYEPNRGARW